MVTIGGLEKAEARIEEAVKIDDLNRAVKLLQDEMGQSDGGVAGICFSSFDNPEQEWATSDEPARTSLLMSYITHERAYAQVFQVGGM